MMAEVLSHLAADIEAELGTGTDSTAGSAADWVAGTMSEVGCTEPGIHHWESSSHLDHRMDSESGHRYSRWRLDHRERPSEGSLMVS